MFFLLHRAAKPPMRSYERLDSRRILRHPSPDLYIDFYKTDLYASAILLARDFKLRFLMEPMVYFLVYILITPSIGVCVLQLNINTACQIM